MVVATVKASVVTVWMVVSAAVLLHLLTYNADYFKAKRNMITIFVL